jgi:hypothetical protein
MRLRSVEDFWNGDAGFHDDPGAAGNTRAGEHVQNS